MRAAGPRGGGAWEMSPLLVIGGFESKVIGTNVKIGGEIASHLHLIRTLELYT